MLCQRQCDREVMMRQIHGRRAFLGILTATAGVVTLSGCATIIEGSKKPDERTGELMWGYVLVDVLLLGVIPLIIDLATGAIYERKVVAQNEVVPITLCPA